MLEVHIRDDCPATEVYCKYKNLGCDAEFPPSNSKSHLESQVERHLSLALQNLEDLTRIVNEQSQQIKRMMVKNEEMSLQIKRLMKRLMLKFSEQSQRTERMETKSFIWKISNFRSLITGDEPNAISESFYLSANGYKLKMKMKMQMKMNVNKRSDADYLLYLSLKVVQGEFDPLFPWLCEEKVPV